MGEQNNFLVKIEGLSSLPPAKSGRACHDNPTGRGYFYQMPNMYTCITNLIQIRKFCSKNLVHKGVDFEAPNAQKSPKSTFNFKKISGGYTPGPIKKGRGGRGEEEEREGAREGRPPNSHSWLRHWYTHA